MSTAPAGSLLAMLAEVPDPRSAQGRRFSCAAMLATVVSGILVGARGCEAISQWIHAQEPQAWHALGYFRKPPCANAFRKLLAALDPQLLEQVLQRWMASLPPKNWRAWRSTVKLPAALCRATKACCICWRCSTTIRNAC